MMKVKSNNSNVWLGGNSILSELNNSRMDIELNEKQLFRIRDQRRAQDQRQGLLRHVWAVLQCGVV